MPEVLSVTNLETKFYTDTDTINAVNGVSFHVEKGETLGVVGESGCGKSVSVLSILRLIPMPPGRIERGEAFFQGKDLLKMTPEEIRRVRGSEIGMVFQDPMTSLNPVINIENQVAEPLFIHRNMNKKQARERVVELLTHVGIPSPEKRLADYPHQFSGGMRQRVMIAMALACNPSLLIADEPTTALDVTIQAQFVELVKHLRDEFKMAIIWITHDLGVIAGIAQRVVVMYAGFIVEHAPVKELYANPQHPYTRGLLGSLPRLDENRALRLVNIKGFPPDMCQPVRGCPFVPRCPYAFDHCRAENPLLMPIADSHTSACWWDIDLGKPRG
ncbi:MAG: ABC transporter ATP-binding protein [Anaerolineales bacterium]|jgi:oligopeptide/dipeptide ABC transporter ATP-binding protein